MRLATSPQVRYSSIGCTFLPYQSWIPRYVHFHSFCVLSVLLIMYFKVLNKYIYIYCGAHINARILLSKPHVVTIFADI